MTLVMTMTISCALPNYLPISSRLQMNPYGSFIQVEQNSLPTITGELIALDSTNLFVLSSATYRCTAIPLNKVASIKIKYAKKEGGAGIIAVYSLLFPISHGWFFPVSFLVNILTSSAIISNAYSMHNIPRAKLKMFARFPQGLPPNIDITEIKRALATKQKS